MEDEAFEEELLRRHSPEWSKKMWIPLLLYLKVICKDQGGKERSTKPENVKKRCNLQLICGPCQLFSRTIFSMLFRHLVPFHLLHCQQLHFKISQIFPKPGGDHWLHKCFVLIIIFMDSPVLYSHPHHRGVIFQCHFSACSCCQLSKLPSSQSHNSVLSNY